MRGARQQILRLILARREQLASVADRAAAELAHQVASDRLCS